MLLVEDDEGMATIVGFTLRSAGMSVERHATGRGALASFGSTEPSLVLLDLMLPDVDGLEVCREIRARSHVPLIMITARDSSADVITGLETGADDYVTKPFEAQELLARVRALLRRNRGPVHDVLRIGDVTVDPVAHRAHKAERELDLTVTEFALVEELARHSGRALSRQQLLELVWGYDHLGDSRVVDMAVQRLRSKIEDDPAAPRLVVTVRGVGYRMESP